MYTSNPAEVLEQMAQTNERLREMVEDDKTIAGNCFGGEVLDEYRLLLDLINDKLKETSKQIQEIIT